MKVLKTKEAYLVKICLMFFLFNNYCFSQNDGNVNYLELQNGFRDFKFGMTSEQLNSLSLFRIPSVQNQFVAQEYGNKDVTYVSYTFDGKGFPANYHLVEGITIKYICFLFYKNKLFKIRIHFFNPYPDYQAVAFDKMNLTYGIYSKKRIDFGGNFIYSADFSSKSCTYHAETDRLGTTMISFEKRGVENSIINDSPFPDDRMPDNRIPVVFSLIVGVDKYNLPNTNNLNYCVNDATIFKNHVNKNMEQDSVIFLADYQANRNNILTNLRRISLNATEKDMLIFYIASHGSTESFLVNDGNLFHKEVKNIIYNSRAKLKLIFADACHSGSWDRSRSGEEVSIRESVSRDNFPDLIGNASPGTILFMACQSDQVSIEDPSFKHGLFTYFLVKGLGGEADANFDSQLTIDEVYNFTQTNVKNYANQTYSRLQIPQLRGIFDLGTIIGKIK